MYTPPDLILDNYAQVLIDFALGSGHGIKKGDVVFLQLDLPALPLARTVYRRILEKGGHPIVRIHEEDFSRILYEGASNEQLEYFPKKHMKSLVDTIDHRIYLIATRDPFLLKEIEPARIMRANKNTLVMKKWLFDKEDRGQLTWTLALYGTEGMAAEAGLSLEQFWAQIEKACFLTEPYPIKVWQDKFKKLEQLRATLSKMPIAAVHVTAKDTDLTVSLGEKRQWLGGGGRNIPSFEIFTSPDWRGTQGYIYFDYPLYRYGNLITDVRLEFKNGRVIKAGALKNDRLIKELVRQKNADKVGEYSLTDIRFSHIDAFMANTLYRYGNLITDVRLEFKNGRVVKAGALKNDKLIKELVRQKNADKVGEYSLTDIRFSHIDAFMANTLYDENFGGKWGNTHLALGSSYHEAYTGDVSSVKPKGWRDLGFNDSIEHTDIIATGDRVVEAVMRNGSRRVIYRKGKFVV